MLARFPKKGFASFNSPIIMFFGELIHQISIYLVNRENYDTKNFKRDYL